MPEILGYVVLAVVLMLAVCAISGRLLARYVHGVGELRRDPRMRSALDEGNDARPSSVHG
jgi:hypothetical protein